MKDHEKILKALANRRRLEILKYIRKGREATVGEVAGHLKLSFKSTSRHLAVLYSAGILDKEQRKLSMFFSFSNPLPKLAKQVIFLICQ